MILQRFPSLFLIGEQLAYDPSSRGSDRGLVSYRITRRVMPSKGDRSKHSLAGGDHGMKILILCVTLCYILGLFGYFVEEAGRAGLFGVHLPKRRAAVEQLSSRADFE